MRMFGSLEELAAAKGEHLGYSAWRTITQDQVNLFADATDEWIHVDPERAVAGPFGKTIAHGYLTLSLAPSFGAEIYRVEGLRMGVNYGLDRVRFPSPVPVGSGVRGAVELVAVVAAPQGVQILTRCTVEIEGQDKPACVAESRALLVT
jgi:acyl dehydratase